MKRFCLLLSCLLLLSACGPKKAEQPEDFTPAYTTAQLSLEFSETLHLQGNGRIIVGARYDDENDGALYLLNPAQNPVTVTRFSDFHGFLYYNLLGVDGADGIWITGTKDDGHIAAERLDITGTVQLSLNFEPTVPDGGIASFTWDDKHYYFLVNSWNTDSEEPNPFDTTLRVYDLEGNEVFRRDLSDYCLGTAGYLPQESDWLEDLEGREGDPLLEMLYPDGPVDEVGLLRLQTGQPGMLISRKSPTETECYGIVCPMDSSDFSITPAMYYPIDTTDSGRIFSSFESANPNYDLLVNRKDGLYGLNLAEQSQTLLFVWDSIGYPYFNLGTFSPSTSDQTCIGPDGTLVLCSWNSEPEGFVLDILSPTS